MKSFGKNPVLVRARVKADLDQLKPYWSKLRVEKDDSADYEFRAIMPRARYMDFLLNKGAEIDYDSHFKEVVRDNAGKRDADGGKARYSAMMSTWTAMSNLQPDAPYSGAQWWKNGYSYGVTSGGTSWQGLCSYHETVDNGNGTSTKKWCIEKFGHANGKDKTPHRFSTGTGGYTFATPKHSETKVTGSAYTPSSPASIVETHYGPTVTGDFPDTVDAMCRELMKKKPEDIQVDEATPYAVYDLWVEAEQNYNEALTLNEVVEMLREMAASPMTVKEAADKYYDAIDTFVDEAIGHGDEDRRTVETLPKSVWDSVEQIVDQMVN